MIVNEEERIRIDKWLWAARIFKTRSGAARAVAGGKVHVNGERIRPAKPVKPGDELRIRRGEHEIVVEVRGVSARRGPAVEARTLYEETADSIRARELRREERRMYNDRVARGRLTKKDRRLIRAFIGKEE